MKTKVTRKVTEEIEIAVVEISIPLDEIDDHEPAIPAIAHAVFADHVNAHWRIRVNIDTGQIESWPETAGAVDLYCKPRDAGTYRLLAPNGNVIVTLDEDYVPNDCIPGEYGDYIDLKIDATGKITNWPKHPRVAKFFRRDLIADGED